MENDRDGPRPRTAAESELEDFLESFTAGGIQQRAELSGPLKEEKYVRRWRVVRMPDDRYRAAIIYHVALWSNPSLNAIETTRELVRSWLGYAGIPVIRFTDAHDQTPTPTTANPALES